MVVYNNSCSVDKGTNDKSSAPPRFGGKNGKNKAGIIAMAVCVFLLGILLKIYFNQNDDNTAPAEVLDAETGQILPQQ